MQVRVSDSGEITVEGTSDSDAFLLRCWWERGAPLFVRVPGEHVLAPRVRFVPEVGDGESER